MSNPNYRANNSHINMSLLAFREMAKLKFRAPDFLSAIAADFLRLAAIPRNTSPEMLVAAALPTTAACIGTKGKLRLKPDGDSYVPANLYLVGGLYISLYKIFPKAGNGLSHED